uniref:BAG family molecular chaperone regulator 2 n=1 Tax=Myxine glutinosa TaxID=7769 RepID=UPI00358FF1D1
MACENDIHMFSVDQLETRVEALREQASAMEREKETLLEMLHGMQSCQDIRNISDGEREELNVTAERLINRVLTVDISLETVRDQEQEQSLNKAMEILDEAALRLKKDMDGSKRCFGALLQACLPDEGEVGGTGARGSIDQKFQSLVIGCALDDQKKIRKRLNMLTRITDNTDRSIRLLDHQYHKGSHGQQINS